MRVMSPYPPYSSVEVLLHDSQSIDRILVLNGFQFPPLERLGSLLSADDLQTAKRGKVADSVVAMDMMKSMEIDDQPACIPVSDGFPAMSECEKGNDVPPTASYARIVCRSGTQVVSEPVPSLDDVVVESSDVMVDKIGLFLLVSFSEKVHERIDHNMCRSLIVCLHGRSIGYKTLLGRIRVLWKPHGAFQVVELTNDYYLVMFENEYDYEHVLMGGPWTVFGVYLTVQSCSREFSTSKSFLVQICMGTNTGSSLSILI
ncbi:hypothetical protein GQ457_10G007510 [Hibiscus cannabinus]